MHSRGTPSLSRILTPAYDGREVVEVDGLREDTVEAALGIFHLREIRRDSEDGNAGRTGPLPHAHTRLIAVHLGEPDIEEHHFRLKLDGDPQSFKPIRSGANGKAKK